MVWIFLFFYAHNVEVHRYFLREALHIFGLLSMMICTKMKDSIYFVTFINNRNNSKSNDYLWNKDEACKKIIVLEYKHM